MPVTARTFLVGAAAISGLPPLNGLVSEFLIFLGFFQGGVSLPGTLGLAALTGAAVLALIGGLALACFAKAVGVVFLGEPRSPAAFEAREAPAAMRLPMIALAFACLAVGVAPPLFVGLLKGAVVALGGGAPGMAPEAVEVAAWRGPLGALGLVSLGTGVLILILLSLRRVLLAGRPVAASPTWDCGYASPTPRMQYTASSFAEPLTTMFRPLLGLRAHLAPPEGYFPSSGFFESHAVDSADRGIWNPVFRAAGMVLGRLRFLQQGRVQAYLVYIFATLLALLAWALLAC
jgi:NADH:ubiquinone oxidoreductase subunit 5 (subunit L)/multisubunit Na+/H+ antiporter MnhA subunit